MGVVWSLVGSPRDRVVARCAAPRRSRRSAAAIVVILGLAGCSRAGGVVGGAVGPISTVAPSATVAGSQPTSPTSAPVSTAGPTTPAARAPAPPTSSSPPAPGTLRLGGDDLGVTRVGSPFREAVAAVTRALGRPTADPAPDTACVGAESETSWEGFRLASNGGRVSGWRSTSKTLATPEGTTVGAPVASLRQAYGAALEIRPAPEPGGLPVFVVNGPRIGGTLSGTAPTATVGSIFNGTCEEA